MKAKPSVTRRWMISYGILMRVVMNKLSDVSYIDHHIGQRMREARLAANCSLEAVACEAGISAPLIRYYERGSRRCYASRLYRIGRFLGVSVSYFYEGLPDNK